MYIVHYYHNDGLTSLLRPPFKQGGFLRKTLVQVRHLQILLEHWAADFVGCCWPSMNNILFGYEWYDRGAAFLKEKFDIIDLFRIGHMKTNSRTTTLT